jgi:hypothetical protein
MAVQQRVVCKTASLANVRKPVNSPTKTISAKCSYRSNLELGSPSDGWKDEMSLVEGWWALALLRSISGGRNPKAKPRATRTVHLVSYFFKCQFSFRLSCILAFRCFVWNFVIISDGDWQSSWYLNAKLLFEIGILDLLLDDLKYDNCV